MRLSEAFLLRSLRNKSGKKLSGKEIKLVSGEGDRE
jgi:hypothetical protein